MQVYLDKYAMEILRQKSFIVSEALNFSIAHRSELFLLSVKIAWYVNQPFVVTNMYVRIWYV